MQTPFWVIISILLGTFTSTLLIHETDWTIGWSLLCGGVVALVGSLSAVSWPYLKGYM